MKSPPSPPHSLSFPGSPLRRSRPAPPAMTSAAAVPTRDSAFPVPCRVGAEPKQGFTTITGADGPLGVTEPPLASAEALAVYCPTWSETPTPKWRDRLALLGSVNGPFHVAVCVSESNEGSAVVAPVVDPPV